MSTKIPKTQKAVQLIAPDELKLNESKPIDLPGPYQILAEVEAVGLCFSDLKLLKQFTGHVRKSEIVSGIDVRSAINDAVEIGFRRPRLEIFLFLLSCPPFWDF